ncbi:MAG: hypothetical protein ACREM1_14415 [Longimicrobiales bacterium]
MSSALHAGTNNRKRNLYLAAAITLLALSFLFAPSESGMLWMMWRDTTWLAVGFVVLAVLFIVLWRRSSRS